MSRKSQYSKIIKFGDIAPKNPLEVCFGDTINNKFQSGVLADTHSGQGSRNCQLLLAEYCGNNWDGYCEMASYNTNTSYPNEVLGCFTPMPGFNLDSSRRMSLGEQLIRNAAFRRFCIAPFATKKCHSFDPTDPKSPMVCYEINDTPCQDSTGEQSICEIRDFSNLDQDPLFNKMLQQPECCIDILVSIYYRAKVQGTLDALMKTNFGRFVRNNVHKFN